MKRLLSIIISTALVFSLSIPALAEETTYSTEVKYVGEASETYSLTVPAELVPGRAPEEVELTGQWASNRVCKVTADKSVILTNSLNSSDTKTVAVRFSGITLSGSNTEAVEDTKSISVAGISNALFGEWDGRFDYQVSMKSVEDIVPYEIPAKETAEAKVGEDGKTVNETQMGNGDSLVQAKLPAGTKTVLSAGTSNLTLQAMYTGEGSSSLSGISIEEGSTVRTYDIDILANNTSAIAEDNDKVIEVKFFAEKDMEDFQLYHDGELMTATDTQEADTYTYDSATGLITMHITHFSDFTTVVAPAPAGATFTDGTFLTWADLKKAENGTEYGYDASVISDTCIDSYAFKGCTNLARINIPEGLRSISYGAFMDCSSLASITLPKSLEDIGELAIDGCKSLTSIIIPSGVTYISNNAFTYSSNLASIKVDTGNTKYDSRNNCNAIIEKATNTLIAGCKNTVIPTSVTSIGNMAFNGCESLASIDIPASVKSIGEYAFNDCNSLVSITIPSGVTSIGNNTFYYCESLTSIELPDSVTSIGECAFHDCKALTSIVLPNSLKSIGDEAFYCCRNLASVTHKGQAYTGKSALETALKNAGVTVGEEAFIATKLTD